MNQTSPTSHSHSLTLSHTLVNAVAIAYATLEESQHVRCCKQLASRGRLLLSLLRASFRSSFIGRNESEGHWLHLSVFEAHHDATLACDSTREG